MKLVTSLIFSLGFAPAITSHCSPIGKQQDVRKIWSELSRRFGEVSFPGGLYICYGKKYLNEVRGGNSMKSALDRAHNRIILRYNNMNLLRHELAHVYLDLRWRVLPYSVSEPLATAIASQKDCNLNSNRASTQEEISRRWRDRGQLDECGLQQLFVDLMSAEQESRAQLPLR